MSLTLVPRTTDRKPIRPRHQGAYYGWALKGVIEPPRPLSIPERLSAWYFKPGRYWPARVLLVLGCALMGLAVVAATYSLRVP